MLLQYVQHLFLMLDKPHTLRRHVSNSNNFQNRENYLSLLTFVNTLSSSSLSHRSTGMLMTSFPVISSTLFRHSVTTQVLSEIKTHTQKQKNLQKYTYSNIKKINFIFVACYNYNYLVYLTLKTAGITEFFGYLMMKFKLQKAV